MNPNRFYSSLLDIHFDHGNDTEHNIVLRSIPCNHCVYIPFDILYAVRFWYSLRSGLRSSPFNIVVYYVHFTCFSRYIHILFVFLPFEQRFVWRTFNVFVCEPISNDSQQNYASFLYLIIIVLLSSYTYKWKIYHFESIV